MLQQSCRIPARASAFWHARELSRGEIEAREASKIVQRDLGPKYRPSRHKGPRIVRLFVDVDNATVGTSLSGNGR